MIENKKITDEQLENVAGGISNKTIIEVSYKEHSWSRQIIVKCVMYSEIATCNGSTVEEKLADWCSAHGYLYQGYRIL